MPNNFSMFAYYKSLFRCPCCLQNVNLDFLNKLVKFVVHNCTPQVVNLSVTDGLTEFWTATDFLTADYNLKYVNNKCVFMDIGLRIIYI